MMTERFEQSVCIKDFVKLGKSTNDMFSFYKPMIVKWDDSFKAR